MSYFHTQIEHCSLKEEQHKLDFVRKAAKAFSKNKSLKTWTEEGYIPGHLMALRFGVDEDCVVVIRIGEDRAKLYAQVIGEEE